MDIKNEILKKLNACESEHNISILHAVESGSRAWGFASPDSDYDVRFIYAHDMEWYLKLEKTRDVMELELNDVYDINGWDIQKLFRLLHDSNPTVFEWIHSPIVYNTQPIIAEITPQIDSFFSCKAGLYHYLNTAKANFKGYIANKDKVKLKKYFYLLRPLMACDWILAHKTPPPVLFDSLLNEMETDDKLFTTICDLIDRKQKADEAELIARIPVLEEYIASEISSIKVSADMLKNDKNNDWELLNSLFLKCLER